ncbi:hypothetical protein Tco_0176929 [Tanacetum coccineum]
MTITNQGLSITEIEHIKTQRVASAIETITIYETKTHMARESMNQTKRQEDKMAKNTSNKRKWEGDHGTKNTKKQGHYRSECSNLKNQNRENQAGSSEARGKVCALGGGEVDQDPNNITDNVNA